MFQILDDHLFSSTNQQTEMQAGNDVVVSVTTALVRKNNNNRIVTYLKQTAVSKIWERNSLGHQQEENVAIEDVWKQKVEEFQLCIIAHDWRVRRQYSFVTPDVVQFY